MRSVILCEGSDDLWFLAYYLHKTNGWNTKNGEKYWKSPKLPTDIGKQEVQYMQLPGSDSLLAIKTVDGQDNFRSSVRDILELNKKAPIDPIHNLIIFRDCDERDTRTLLDEMEEWVEDTVTLQNNQVCNYPVDDEYDLTLHILPLIIPFDEPGAIETLLLKAVSDHSGDGRYVAEHAKEFVLDAKEHTSEYLTSQRFVTKAKYAAAMAIIDPTHSRDEFNKLVMSTPWEESASIRNHMEIAARLIADKPMPVGV